MIKKFQIFYNLDGLIYRGGITAWICLFCLFHTSTVNAVINLLKPTVCSDSFASKASSRDVIKSAGTTLSIAASQPMVQDPLTLKINSGQESVDQLPQLSEFFHLLLNTDSTKLSGHNTQLKWEDFDAIDRAILNLKENLPALKNDTILNQTFSRLTFEIFDRVEGLKTLRIEIQQPLDLSKISLAKVTLVKSYRTKVETLFQILPFAMSLNLQSIPKNTDAAHYKIMGEEVMVEQTFSFKKLLPQLGFANMQEFTDYITRSETADVDAIDKIRIELRALDKGQFEFAMRRPVGARFWLAQGTGFQNQRETGSSGGELDTEARDLAESKGLGVLAAEYFKQTNDLKPSYGYLSPDLAHLDIRRFDAAVGYGSDLYFFKKESVRRRVSFTFGDSLFPFIKSEKQKWDTTFIPWQFHQLISLARILVSEGRASSKPSSFSIKGNYHPGGSFVELQFWGPLNLEDVGSFISTLR